MILEEDMNGPAIVAALATCPGPDCFKDVVKKVGQRLRVYNSLKTLVNQFEVQ